MSTRVGPRGRGRGWIGTAVAALTATAALASTASLAQDATVRTSTKRLTKPAAAATTTASAAAQTGFQAHSFAGLGAGDAVTGEKPESKLWFHDGFWWAAMVSPAEGGAHTIHRLDGTTWTDTGVVLDSRATAREDVLSLGSTLYVITRTTNGAQNLLRRFTYSGGAYSLSAGPVGVPGAGAETITLARDTTGVLWLTYEAGQRINVARSQGSDTSWGAPFVIPNSAVVRDDDISSIISFTDATGPAIGVMWSDQNAQRDFFAVHRDGAADTSWTIETALSGTNEADDHINLKTLDGQVFAAVKTSASSSSNPLIRLLRRSPSGAWSAHPVALVSEGGTATRPITMLEIDAAANKAYVFYSKGATGRIVYKVTSTTNITFGTETTFIQGDGADINNATSMKDNATSTSGIVVLASDSSHYWWNRLGGSSTPPPSENSAPVAQNGSATTNQDTPVDITLRATDADAGDCDLAFSIVGAPASGDLGSLSSSPCTTGTPNSDSAGVTYTPDPGFTGADSFTFKANDGSADSNVATVSITVSPTGGGGGGAIEFRSASSGRNANATTLLIDKPSGVGEGDVMIAAIVIGGIPNTTPPTGWQAVRTDSKGKGLRQIAYVKVAGASEPESYTWTFSSSHAAVGGILAFTGVDSGAPVDVSGGRANAKSSSITAPSVTTTVANAMVVGLFGIKGRGTIAPPAGMTEGYDVASVTGRPKVTSEGAYVVHAGTGATGDKVASASRSAVNIGQLVALRPAP
jgi:hypothetical protein